MQRADGAANLDELSDLEQRYAHLAENLCRYSESANKVDWINAIVRRSFMYFIWSKNQNSVKDYSDRNELLLHDQYNMLQLEGAPRIRKVAVLMRYIQKIFFWYKSRDVIQVYDWTSSEAAKKRKDTLVPNSIIPWKGYYIVSKKRYLIKYNALIDKHYTLKQGEIQNIKTKLKNCGNDLSTTDIEDYCFVVKALFELNRDKIVSLYAAYDELLMYYKPKLIVIPGETFFGSVILTQLARKYNVKTLLMIDGFQINVPKNTLYMDRSGNNLIFDYFCAYGQGHKDLLKNGCGIASDRILTLRAPVLSFYDNNKIRGNRFDAIVLAYSPRTSLSCKYSQDMTTTDVTDLLVLKGFKNIAIKIKKGSGWMMKSKILVHLERYKDKNVNIHFVHGQMYDVLKDASLVVGQISSAIYECAYCDIPFFVYEPPENGKYNREISKSTILNTNLISRDLISLGKAIDNNNMTIQSDYKYLFSGAEYESVSLERFKF